MLNASRPLAALACLAVTGCSSVGGGPYPSLLPRPIESRSDAEPSYTPPPVVTDPALDAAIAANATQRSDIQRRLAPAERRATALGAAARGAPEGSERWIEAQTALAELDGLRAESSGALTDLEQRAIDRAAQGLPDYPALETARRAAAAQVAAQAATIERLQRPAR